jgi:hypothetical protein
VGFNAETIESSTKSKSLITSSKQVLHPIFWIILQEMQFSESAKGIPIIFVFAKNDYPNLRY